MQKIHKQHYAFGPVLLTRPSDKSQQLSQMLAAHDIPSHCTPLLSIVAIDEPEMPSKLAALHPDDIVIAISVNAVINADAQIEHWPSNPTYLAVGQASVDAFLAIGISAKCPKIATSEGLLALPILSNVKNRSIVILRGEGGREILAQQLTARGARVSYCQLYRRQSLVSNRESEVLTWQQKKINIIVVTSAEIFLTLYQCLADNHLAWLRGCTVIVPSMRVAQAAYDHGLTNVETANGASNQAILQKLLKLQSSSNEK